MTEKEELKLKEKIVRAIKTVFDPEIPVDVYELGLIYDIQILPLDNVHILMTLTSPNCPAAETIPADVKNRVEMIKEIKEVLLDPEDGIIVRVNKNTYWRKQINIQEIEELKSFKNNVTKALWGIYTVVLGIIAKLMFWE